MLRPYSPSQPAPKESPYCHPPRCTRPYFVLEPFLTGRSVIPAIPSPPAAPTRLLQEASAASRAGLKP